MNSKITKIIRFISIYGLSRTASKVAGRSRGFYFLRPIFFLNNPRIGLIGCGQFQFSTIAFYLSRNFTNYFLFCYDIDNLKSKSLGKFYKIPNVVLEKKNLSLELGVKLVYIASNHASHSSYAIDFLRKGVDVYCEKPIAVNFIQLDLLVNEIKFRRARFFAGYNRPYSKAIKFLNSRLDRFQLDNEKFTLSCFVSAHDIPKDHWYRDENEGSRICGNVGHWIDLMIHVYNWRGYIPISYNVQVAYSNLAEPDDNIVISITTSEGDLFSVLITARSEPFEGINESINFQCSSIIAKIDDFRRITLWDNDKIIRKRFFPKDVGHKKSVMQPFMSQTRDLNEVVKSTELMIHIAEMVKNCETQRNVTLNRSI
jgi:predicted dehydrogenase